MVENRRVQFALAQLAGRLHKAVGEKRCGCGPCAYWVAAAARGAGIPRAELEAALPPAAKPAPRRARRPRPMQVQICESSTIRARGNKVDQESGIGLLLTRLREG